MKKVLVFVLTPLFLFGKTEAPPIRGNVVLLHGLMRTKLCMSQIGYNLKKDNWNVHNWDYPSRSENIEDLALILVKELQKLAAKEQGKPINFVTFSMGGLVLRAAINHPDCPGEAKMGRAVLIAPPNRGTIYARALSRFKIAKWYLGKKAGRQLMKTPRDGFDALGEFPKKMPVLVISGTMGWNPSIDAVNDGKVGIHETCLNTPHYHEMCRAGHSWICNNKTAIKHTKHFLGNKKITNTKCMIKRDNIRK